MGRSGGIALAALALVLAAAGGLYVSAGFLDRDPRSIFAPTGPRAGVAALYFSGDMGLRFGMGPPTAHALSAHGIPVLGVSTPALFGTHRSGAQTDAIVADAVRDALRLAGRDRLVLIGQSFGADVLQTGLLRLPEVLRRRVAAVILVVPGRDVFFRADPTGLAYRGRPESDGRATLRRLGWTPLTCIYGAEEHDSACPGLTNATVIAMPGGHFLNRDDAALTDHVLAAIRRVAPTLLPE